METEHLLQGHLLVKTRTWFETEVDLGVKAPVYVAMWLLTSLTY